MPLPTSGKGLELLIIQICCGIFVYILACLRLCAQHINRKRQPLHNHTVKRKLSLHDILMHISVLLYTAQAIVVVRGIMEGGIGQHVNTIDNVEITKGFQTWYFGELIYAVLSCLIKTSVILFMQEAYIGRLRTGKSTDRRYVRWTLYICLRVIWAASIVFLSASIFQCSPPNHYWKQFENPSSEGACSKRVVPAAGIALSIVMAASDWALASVPIVALWKTKIPWQKKAAIQALSSLGIVAGAVMIVRIPYIRTLDLTKDFLYETVDVAKWTVIEAAIGIVAGCLPTSRPLLRFIIPRRTPLSQGRPVTETWTCRTHIQRGPKPSKDLVDGAIHVQKSISQVRILNSDTGGDVEPRHETRW